MSIYRHTSNHTYMMVLYSILISLAKPAPSIRSPRRSEAEGPVTDTRQDIRVVLKARCRLGSLDGMPPWLGRVAVPGLGPSMGFFMVV